MKNEKEMQISDRMKEDFKNLMGLFSYLEAKEKYEEIINKKPLIGELNEISD
jgi:hypothetical protein